MNQRVCITMPPPTAPPVSLSGTIRLTIAQALVRYLAALRLRTATAPAAVRRRVRDLRSRQRGRHRRGAVPHRDALPTLRAHNEQAMAHAAIAFAKAHFRRRMMACTTSIGPGATNLVTAAALAHVNRLPVLLLPGDVFVSRAPDPVLQQVEDFHDGGVSANDCFKPVSRYFDRIMHPAHSRQHLAEVMPGIADCLDRYEWAKHGTCSGMGADAYFSRAIELVNRANRALGRQIFILVRERNSLSPITR